jgi:hypothetical protein
VTPWPVTAHSRIVGLAVRTSRLLADLARDPTLRLGRRELSPFLEVDGRFLGRGYGYPTSDGRAALASFEALGGPALDTTYSAKSAACLIDRVRRSEPGPVVYWATKSTAPLPPIDPARLDAAPPRMRRWMRRAESHEAQR